MVAYYLAQFANIFANAPMLRDGEVTPTPITEISWTLFQDLVARIVSWLPIPNLIAIMGGLVGLSAGFVLVWAFGRKGIRSVMSAMTKGRFKI